MTKAAIQARVDEFAGADRSVRPVGQVSGATVGRAAAARGRWPALATSPSLLLLDEPLSALDARVRLRLRDEIRSCSAGSASPPSWSPMTRRRRSRCGAHRRDESWRDRAGRHAPGYLRAPATRSSADFRRADETRARRAGSGPPRRHRRADAGLRRNPTDQTGGTVEVGFRPEAAEISDARACRRESAGMSSSRRCSFSVPSRGCAAPCPEPMSPSKPMCRRATCRRWRQPARGHSALGAAGLSRPERRMTLAATAELAPIRDAVMGPPARRGLSERGVAIGLGGCWRCCSSSSSPGRCGCCCPRRCRMPTAIRGAGELHPLFSRHPPLVAALVNSIWVSVAVTVIVVPLAFIYAYALTRSLMPARGLFTARFRWCRCSRRRCCRRSR